MNTKQKMLCLLLALMMALALSPACAVTLNGSAVTIEALGTVHTQILDDEGEAVYILTADLTFPEGVPAEQQLAYIVAPNTGRAAMRESPSKSEKIVRYCAAGDILVVLEVGDDYSLVNHNGEEGYLQTSCLQFFAVAEEDGEYALLSYEERTDGRTTINVRNQPDRTSCKIAEWHTGTEVTVWNYVDGWYEIEANGMRGFVMEQYISIAPGV